MSVAGFVAAVLGVIILLAAAMPWYSVGFEDDVRTFSGWGLAGTLSDDLEDGLPWVFVWTLAALALGSMVSVLLPRAVPIAIGIAGLAVTVVAMVYVVGATEVTDQRARDAGVTFSFGGGAWLTALAFILIAGLHLIPSFYKPVSGEQAAE